MDLEVITYNSSNIYKVRSIHFSGKNDSFSVLANHAPLIKIMHNGIISTKGDNGVNISINNALIKVLNNYITVVEL